MVELVNYDVTLIICASESRVGELAARVSDLGSRIFFL